jgi:hypothetical protein
VHHHCLLLSFPPINDVHVVQRTKNSWVGNGEIRAQLSERPHGQLEAEEDTRKHDNELVQFHRKRASNK